jgi:hypothetical protein
MKSQFKPGVCGYYTKYLDLTGCPIDQAVSIIKHFPVNKMRLTSTAETILSPKGPYVILVLIMSQICPVHALPA